MRHAIFGRKLHRTKNERQQLFRNLLRALIAHGRLTTTIAKAKSVQPTMEKLITKAKTGTEHARRGILADLGGDKESTQSLMGMAKTRFNQRVSGFTRLVKLGARQGDAAEMVELSFVDAPVVIEPKKEIVKNKEEVKKVKAAKPKVVKKTPAKK